MSVQNFFIVDKDVYCARQSARMPQQHMLQIGSPVARPLAPASSASSPQQAGARVSST